MTVSSLTPELREQLGLGENATGLVDLLHGQDDTGELGRPEEGERPGLGQQGADG